MNIQEATAFIHGTLKFGSVLGLETMRRLLARLGDPQKRLRFVHVAGTNGKGSTAAFLSSILSAAGYKTGMYTSPYIERFNERIQVNGAQIQDCAIARLTEKVKATCDGMVADGFAHPTEFELVTALGFLYFAETGCDVIVLEVGLGGRLDATNIIPPPALAVITTLSLDHTAYLGGTIERIAFEKAGIIKAGTPVLMYPQEPGAEAVIGRVCAEQGAPLHRADFGTLQSLRHSLEGQVFHFQHMKNLEVKLLGAHQQKNAAMAILAAKLLNDGGFRVTDSHIRRGLLAARWPGRFEPVRKRPAVILDGAHNLQGAQILAENLATYFPGRKVSILMGVLADKDVDGMIAAVAPVAKSFAAVKPGNPRALPADELAARITRVTGMAAGAWVSPAKALRTLLSDVSETECFCIFGSLYFIGAARQFFE